MVRNHNPTEKNGYGLAIPLVTGCTKGGGEGAVSGDVKNTEIVMQAASGEQSCDDPRVRPVAIADYALNLGPLPSVRLKFLRPGLAFCAKVMLKAPPMTEAPAGGRHRRMTLPSDRGAASCSRPGEASKLFLGMERFRCTHRPMPTGAFQVRSGDGVTATPPCRRPWGLVLGPGRDARLP